MKNSIFINAQISCAHTVIHLIHFTMQKEDIHSQEYYYLQNHRIHCVVYSRIESNGKVVDRPTK